MRDSTQLHPILQCKIKQLQSLCEKEGLIIGISECYRTKTEQDNLYAQGRTKAGKIVTNVKFPNSMHCWKVAFDFFRNDGKGAYNNSDGFFNKVGKIGQTIGLEWGGSWKSFVDLPHFQLPYWGSNTSKLKVQFGSPDKFFNSLWKAGNTYTLKVNSAIHNTASSSGASKVMLKDTKSAMKKKCKADGKGYAVMQKGSKFTLVDMKICTGYIMGKTNQGYWIPLYYNDKKRI